MLPGIGAPPGGSRSDESQPDHSHCRATAAPG